MFYLNIPMEYIIINIPLVYGGDKVEEYLKEYIGNHYEILETAEKVYIGVDFPDEFCHSQDKIE